MGPWSSRGRWRVGIDVGGTFTDVVLIDEETGRLAVRKVPTVAEDPVQGVLDGVAAALAHIGVAPSQVVYVGAGSTLALNTVLQRSGVPTGLLVTEGFRDVLELRRTRLPDAPSFEAARPVPLVRRAHVREVRERLAADGSVVRPLDSESVVAAAAALVAAGVQAVAICFLHAPVNPSHERAAAALVERRWPDLFVCTSSETWPQPREYERALVTVMNAYVGPVMRRYYTRLEEGLRRLGVEAPVMVTQSNGGTLPLWDAARNPVRTMLSGPAAGVEAASRMGEEVGRRQIVTLDMGGTSADMAVVDGTPRVSTESTIGEFPFFIPSVAVHTIGAGGGSIARVDDHGLLKVGPESVGSAPGPAAYGRGGTRPTVTDAYLQAGILGPRDMLGGTMELVPGEAARALGQLARPLGRDVAGTEDAVIEVATAAMVGEILPLLARYGVDPREFVLVAFGGAGPTHAFDVAREAGMLSVLVPPVPGAMCAVGAALADIQIDFVAPLRAVLADSSGLQAAFRDLESQASRWVAQHVGTGGGAEFRRRADMRYRGQSYELVVDLRPGEDPADTFRRQFERVYGYRDSQASVEVLALRVTAVVPSPRPPRWPPPAREGPPVPVEVRTVRYRGREWEVPVYRRGDLLPGVRLPGPAIVTQYDTTTFVTPGFDFWTDAMGNMWGEARP